MQSMVIKMKLNIYPEPRAYMMLIQGQKRSTSANGHYSQSQTINAIILEHKELFEENAMLKTEIVELKIQLDRKTKPIS